jgi:hypothetical protein
LTENSCLIKVLKEKIQLFLGFFELYLIRKGILSRFEADINCENKEQTNSSEKDLF